MKNKKTLSLGIASAAAMALGILLSGPVGTLIVGITRPQPNWVDAKTFITNFDKIQALPFLFGFLTIVGSIIFITSLYRLSDDKKKEMMVPGLIFIGIFGTIASFNCLIQGIYLPNIVLSAIPGMESIISALTMTNPSSFPWIAEAFSSAFFGLALASTAVYFGKSKLDGLIRGLLIANAVVSFFPVIMILIDSSWFFSFYGLVCSFFESAIIICIAVMSTVSLCESKKS